MFIVGVGVGVGVDSRVSFRDRASELDNKLGEISLCQSPCDELEI